MVFWSITSPAGQTSPPNQTLMMVSHQVDGTLVRANTENALVWSVYFKSLSSVIGPFCWHRKYNLSLLLYQEILFCRCRRYHFIFRESGIWFVSQLSCFQHTKKWSKSSSPLFSSSSSFLLSPWLSSWGYLESAEGWLLVILIGSSGWTWWEGAPSSSPSLKGKLGQIFSSKFLSAAYSLNRQFSQKRPNVDQKRVKVSKIDKIRTKWHLTHCGNPPILSSKRLWQEMYWNLHPSWLCNIDRVKFDTPLLWKNDTLLPWIDQVWYV